MRVRMIDQSTSKESRQHKLDFRFSLSRKTSPSSIWTTVGFFHVWDFPSDIENPFRYMTRCLAISDFNLANG